MLEKEGQFSKSLTSTKVFDSTVGRGAKELPDESRPIRIPRMGTSGSHAANKMREQLDEINKPEGTNAARGTFQEEFKVGKDT